MNPLQRGRRLPPAVLLIVLVACAMTVLIIWDRHSRSPDGAGIRPDPAVPPSRSNRQAVGCLNRPSACGFPDASNTGVPEGAKLTPSRGIEISTPGQVVSGLDVAGCVKITARNVTFRDSRVRGDCSPSPIIATSYDGSTSGTVIAHVEVDGGRSAPSSPGIAGADFIVVAANIHGTGDGVDVQSSDTVRDSYIHDLWVAAGDHADGVQSAGGTGTRVDHNTILADCAGCNSAMIIGADIGPIGTFGANDNLLDGGGFTLYAGTGGHDSGTIEFTGNRFGKHHRYGVHSFKPSAGRAVGFTGNISDDTAKPLSP